MTIDTQPASDWAARLAHGFATRRPPARDPLVDRLDPISRTADYELWSFRLRWRDEDGQRSASLWLRAYLGPDAPARASREAAALEMAAACGVMAPLLWLPPTAKESHLAFERAEGEAFGGAWRRRRVDATPDRFALALADLHSRTERAERRTAETAVSNHQRKLRERIEIVGAAGLREVVNYLEHSRPRPAATALCHGDYRPENLRLLSVGQEMLVGWSRAEVGDPRLDVARLSLSLTEDWGGALRTPVLKTYRRVRPVSPEELAWFEILAGVERMVSLGEMARSGDEAARARATRLATWLRDRMADVADVDLPTIEQ